VGAAKVVVGGPTKPQKGRGGEGKTKLLSLNRRDLPPVGGRAGPTVSAIAEKDKLR